MTTPSADMLLAEALGLSASHISDNTNFETCENWDSLAHFRVIAAIEEALGRSLTAEEIFTATDYVGVKSLLSENQSM